MKIWKRAEEHAGWQRDEVGVVWPVLVMSAGSVCHLLNEFQESDFQEHLGQLALEWQGYEIGIVWWFMTMGAGSGCLISTRFCFNLDVTFDGKRTGKLNIGEKAYVGKISRYSFNRGRGLGGGGNGDEFMADNWEQQHKLALIGPIFFAGSPGNIPGLREGADGGETGGHPHQHPRSVPPGSPPPLTTHTHTVSKFISQHFA